MFIHLGLNHRKQRNRAQGMVEFALMLPVLLMVIYGIFEGGRAVMIYSIVSSAAREAARYGSASSSGTGQYRDCTGIRNAAKKVDFLNVITDANIVIAYASETTPNNFTLSCDPGVLNTGARIRVTVTATYAPVVSIAKIKPVTVSSYDTRTLLGKVTISGAIISPPSISKAFAPATIASGGTSTLTFTITNSNSSLALTGVGFHDSLPAGMQVASPPSASTTSCGSPTFAPAAGATSLSFSNGTIAISGTCTARVNVTASSVGLYTNTSEAVTSTEAGAGNTASAALSVPMPPSISKSFLTDPIVAGTTTTLRFTITNPNPGAALTGVGFTDTLPAGTQVASPPSASTSGCGSPTFAPAAGVTLLTFSNGTIAASGTCTVNVNVTAASRGIYTNTSGAVTSTEGGTGNTASDTLTVTAIPPTINKAFAPTSIPVGGSSILTFTITNPNTGTILTAVAFNDTFPADMQVASTPGAGTSGCGSPTFAPAAGATALAFSGGTIAASGTCTVNVNVTATALGAKANTSGAVTSTESGPGGTTATVTLTAVGPPTFSKVFAPVSIPVGGTSTLTFTLTNPNSGTSLTGVAFNDTLPAGMQVAATPSVTKTGCGAPTFAPAAGATSLTFSGGTIAASGTCTASVNVTVTTLGAKANTSGAVTSANGGTGGTASATLTAAAAPTIGKVFAPTTIPVSGTSTLTFTLTNPNSFAALTGVAFNDTFPAGMQVAATPVAGTSGCGSPTFAPAAGATALAFSAGTIAASGTCTVNVNVTATTNGSKVNTSGAVSSTNGGTGNTAAATLTAIAAPTIGKAFAPATILLGVTSTLTFTLTNPNSFTSLTGVAFNDTFPSGVQVAATPNFSTTGCGSPTFAPAAAATSLAFSNGTIVASGTCTARVDITATTAGAKANTSGAVTSDNGGTGGTASASLNAIGPPNISKTFVTNPMVINTNTVLRFTITNPNSGTSLTGVAFTDSLPAGVQVAATPGASNSGCGSPTFAPAAGATTLTFSGGTIAASGTCTVNVNVTATTVGSKVNTSSAVTSTNGGSGNTASKTLTVTYIPPSISKLFVTNPVVMLVNTILRFTITNPNTGIALTGVGFTDALPSGVVVYTTPGAGTSGCGSPTFAPAALDTTLAFSGGTIAASGTCTVNVNVIAALPGSYPNTSGAVTSTNGGTGNTASATLTVNRPACNATTIKHGDPTPIANNSDYAWTIYNYTVYPWQINTIRVDWTYTGSRAYFNTLYFNGTQLFSGSAGTSPYTWTWSGSAPNYLLNISDPPPATSTVRVIFSKVSSSIRIRVTFVETECSGFTLDSNIATP